MERKTRSLFAVLAAVVIVIAVFSSFAISLFGQSSYNVSLPDPEESSPAGQPGSSADPGGQFTRVEVTAETVQSVIAQLFRPQSYYRQVRVELWAGAAASVQATVSVWADNGWTRSDVAVADEPVQHNLVGEGTRWLWYGDSGNYRFFPADAASADLAQHIPTYEDVLELPRDQITDTGYERYNGADCIYVEVLQEELDSQERYWISVTDGLLLAAERVKDGQVVYRMTTLSTVESPAPLDSSFALPDGTVLHTVGENET